MPLERIVENHGNQPSWEKITTRPALVKPGLRYRFPIMATNPNPRSTAMNPTKRRFNGVNI